MTSLPDGLAVALTGFGLPQPNQARRAERGVQNEVWVLEFPTERLVLKRFRRGDSASLRRVACVMDQVRSGLPVPELRPCGGGRVLETAWGCFTLSEHARGVQPDRSALTPRHAAAMGRALARLHLQPDVGEVDLPLELPAPATPVVLPVLGGLISEITGESRGDQEVREHLRARWEWLRAHADDPPLVPRRTRLVHGDFTDANLFFADGEVSAVIDWDQTHLGCPEHELMRAAHLSFVDRAELWAAFLQAYRAARPLDLDELDAAAEAYAYRRDRGLWVFQELYVRGNEAVRQYLPGPAFVPWIQRWRSIRAHIA